MNCFSFINPIYVWIVYIIFSISASSCSKSSVNKDGTDGPEVPPIDIIHPLEKGFPPKDFSYPASAFDLTDMLPAGYVTDGSVDYTTYLQEGLDDNPIVVFPDFPILISRPGLRVRSNARVYFREQSKLIMEGTNSENYYMILLLDAKDVLLKNICIEGDRNRHLGTTGEWGRGIYISGCENITIDHATITNCWGDGIALTQDTWNAPSKEISIINSIIDSCRRSSITIGSANGVTIEKCILQNTNGPTVSSGLTIEPNGRGNDIHNIIIKNCMTVQNENVGIRIVTASIYGTEGGIKNSSIKILQHKDKSSQFGISFVLGHPSKSGGVNGKIELEDIILQDNAGRAIVDYTTSGSEVLYSTYFKNIYPVQDGYIDKSEKDYLNKLIENREYFYWKE